MIRFLSLKILKYDAHNIFLKWCSSWQILFHNICLASQYLEIPSQDDQNQEILVVELENTVSEDIVWGRYSETLSAKKNCEFKTKFYIGWTGS